tara:strand:+ start:7255 stop:8865 length:1611 start_codon:yes stop_codon:yes gene_type:complete
MRASYRQERRFEQQSLVARRKLIEKRFQTLRALDKKADSAEKGLGGIAASFLGGALGIRGLRMASRFLGGGGGTVTRGRGGGPKFPRLPGRGPRITGGGGRFRLPRLGGGPRITGAGLRGLRVGPLAVAFTGLDFASRLGEGQNLTQATVGAGGGLAGALAGGAAGTKAGIAIGGSIGALFGGVGAVPGAAIGGFIGGLGGSIIGGFAGSGIADFFTGANKRRKKDIQQLAIEGVKTPFSLALDKFDSVLNKLEKRGLPSSPDSAVARRGRGDDVIRFPGFAVPKPKNPLGSRILEILSTAATILTILSLIVTIWAAAVAEPTFAGEMAAASATPGLLNIISGKLRTMKLLLFRGGLKVSRGQVKAPSTIVKKFSGSSKVSISKTGIKGSLSETSPLKTMKFKKRFLRKGDIDGNEVPIPRPGDLGDLTGGAPIDWRTISKMAPRKEEGGQVEAGKPYKVGEIGEELFIPNQDGMIVSNAGLNPVTPMTIVNNNSNQMSPPSGGAPAPSGGGSSPAAVDPFIAATKYAQMQSLLTV